MGRLISGACCLIVGVQVLVGVPLAVCIAFLSWVHSGSIGSIEIHVRSGQPARENSIDTTPITHSQPQATRVSGDLAVIMASRGERGSLLRGTALAGSTSEEDEVIVDVLERLARQQRDHVIPIVPDPELDTEQPAVREFALGCAAEWSRLAAEQELAGNSVEAIRYLELARQCATEASEPPNPAILPGSAN